VDYLLHKASNVAMSLGVIERSELGRGFVVSGVCREDRATALPLVSNYPTHCDDGWVRCEDGELEVSAKADAGCV